MEPFLIFADAVFIIFTVLFMFFPKAVVTLNRLANQALVYTDEKIYAMRKIAALICLGLSVFLTVAIMVLKHLIYMKIW